MLDFLSFNNGYVRRERVCMDTLEREFYLTRMRHKGAILMAKIIEYYRDKEEKRQGVKIPDCLMLGLWQRQG